MTEIIWIGAVIFSKASFILDVKILPALIIIIIIIVLPLSLYVIALYNIDKLLYNGYSGITRPF